MILSKKAWSYPKRNRHLPDECCALLGRFSGRPVTNSLVAGEFRRL